MPSYLASPSTQRKPVKFEMGVYSSTPAAQAQQLYADSPATSAKPLPPAQAAANAQEFLAAAAARAEEREDAEVGLSHKDSDEQTFTEYVPHTFSAAIFRAHPDPVVETASLSSLMPPKTSHKLHLCAKTITQGLLTNLQVPQQSPFPLFFAPLVSRPPVCRQLVIHAGILTVGLVLVIARDYQFGVPAT